MKVGTGSDAAGMRLLQKLVSHIEHLGHHVTDFSQTTDDADDCREPAFRVARAVASRQVTTAILISGSGVGMCIAANKVSGIRATLCADRQQVDHCRTHFESNVLCLSSDLLNCQAACDLLDAWITSWDS